MSYGAVVTLRQEDATHTIVPNTEGMAVDPDEDLCRTLVLPRDKKKDSLTYVHWWFCPASYDEWMTEKVRFDHSIVPSADLLAFLIGLRARGGRGRCRGKEQDLGRQAAKPSGFIRFEGFEV